MGWNLKFCFIQVVYKPQAIEVVYKPQPTECTCQVSSTSPQWYRSLRFLKMLTPHGWRDISPVLLVTSGERTKRQRHLTQTIPCEQHGRYAAPERWSSSEPLQPCDRSPELRSQTDGWHGNRLRWLSNHLPRHSGCEPSPRRRSARHATSGSGCNKQRTLLTARQEVLSKTPRLHRHQPHHGQQFSADRFHCLPRFVYSDSRGNAISCHKLFYTSYLDSPNYCRDAGFCDNW